MRSKQKIFEIVAKHLFAQGQLALSYDGNCAYRGADGTKCAVGVLIPDKLYDPSFEGYSADIFINEDENGWQNDKSISVGLKVPEIKTYSDLIFKLQSTHDTINYWDSTNSMRAALKNVALEFNLGHNFLNKLSFTNR